MVVNKYLVLIFLCFFVNNLKLLLFFIGNIFLNFFLVLFKIFLLWIINKNLLGFIFLIFNVYKIVLFVLVVDIINVLFLVLFLIVFNDFNVFVCIKLGIIFIDFFILLVSSIWVCLIFVNFFKEWYLNDFLYDLIYCWVSGVFFCYNNLNLFFILLIKLLFFIVDSKILCL